MQGLLPKRLLPDQTMVSASDSSAWGRAQRALSGPQSGGSPTQAALVCPSTPGTLIPRFSCRVLTVGFVFAIALLTTGSLRAQAPPLLPADSGDIASLVQRGSARELLRQLIIDAIPERYENTKRWGQTKKVWDGVDVSFYRLRLKTKRKWREANHGTWKRYEARLIDPQQTFDVRVENIRPTESDRVAFDIHVDARLATFGRLSEWQLGLQLFSFGVDADATVRLQMTCEARLRLDFKHLVPDILIEPEITDASLQLVDFDLKRISDLRGPGVRELGDSLRGVLQDEINKRRPKLVAQANRQIEKKRDKLRLSVSDLAKDGWQKARGLLGGDEGSDATVPESG